MCRRTFLKRQIGGAGRTKRLRKKRDKANGHRERRPTVLFDEYAKVVGVDFSTGGSRSFVGATFAGIPVVKSELAYKTIEIRKVWKRSGYRENKVRIRTKAIPQCYVANFPGYGQQIIAHPQIVAALEQQYASEIRQGDYNPSDTYGTMATCRDGTYFSDGKGSRVCGESSPGAVRGDRANNFSTQWRNY